MQVVTRSIGGNRTIQIFSTQIQLSISPITFDFLYARREIYVHVRRRSPPTSIYHNPKNKRHNPKKGTTQTVQTIGGTPLLRRSDLEAMGVKVLVRLHVGVNRVPHNLWPPINLSLVALDLLEASGLLRIIVETLPLVETLDLLCLPLNHAFLPRHLDGSAVRLHDQFWRVDQVCRVHDDGVQAERGEVLEQRDGLDVPSFIRVVRVESRLFSLVAGAAAVITRHRFSWGADQEGVLHVAQLRIRKDSRVLALLCIRSDNVLRHVLDEDLFAVVFPRRGHDRVEDVGV